MKNVYILIILISKLYNYDIISVTYQGLIKIDKP